MHRTRSAVELSGRGSEEAASAKHASFHVAQPVFQHGFEAGDTARALQGWLHDLLHEDCFGRLDRSQLQLYLRPKVSKYTGLAHLQFGREAADGKPLQSFRRRNVNRDLQDMATVLGGLIGVVENSRFHRTTVLYYSTVVLQSTLPSQTFQTVGEVYRLGRQRIGKVALFASCCT